MKDLIIRNQQHSWSSKVARIAFETGLQHAHWCRCDLSQQTPSSRQHARQVCQQLGRFLNVADQQLGLSPLLPETSMAATDTESADATEHLIISLSATLVGWRSLLQDSQTSQQQRNFNQTMSSELANGLQLLDRLKLSLAA